MGSDALRERLLQVMDRKDHWAWPRFAQGKIPLQKLLVHFTREWEVYVRDFPVLLARVLGHGPPDPVRRALSANIYEEQTGGISGADAHPALFLKMMRGCGYAMSAFERVELPPAARAYREFLDRMSWEAPWQRGAAVLTLFVEGSINERREYENRDMPHQKTPEDIELAVARHPLVRIHSVAPADMELIRVHQRIEGGHRDDAWMAVLGHVSPEQEPLVVEAMQRALELWLAYRDEVAVDCGVTRG